MMTKEINVMKLQNRIVLMSYRNKENERIVRKLKRRLRNMLAESPVGEN